MSNGFSQITGSIHNIVSVIIKVHLEIDYDAEFCKI